jgi:hypothetical protein
MKKIFACLLALVTISGCATNSVMDGIMSSWINAPLAEAVMQWGLPNREIKIGDKRMYQWDRSTSVIMPTYSTSVTSGSATAIGNTAVGGATTTTFSNPGQILGFSCERILLVNNKDIIERATYKGNNCPFLEIDYAATWRRK